jgi:hypothetical protein
MQDKPSAEQLLDGVRRFLEEEIVPTTTGRRQFLARVSVNVMRIVERELASEDRHTQREWVGLDRILGESGTLPSARTERGAAIRTRVEDLCERIRAGEFDEGCPAREPLLAHLRATVRDKIEVTNAAYLEADASRAAPLGGRGAKLPT